MPALPRLQFHFLNSTAFAAVLLGCCLLGIHAFRSSFDPISKSVRLMVSIYAQFDLCLWALQCVSLVFGILISALLKDRFAVLIVSPIHFQFVHRNTLWGRFTDVLWGRDLLYSLTMAYSFASLSQKKVYHMHKRSILLNDNGYLMSIMKEACSSLAYIWDSSTRGRLRCWYVQYKAGQ